MTFLDNVKQLPKTFSFWTAAAGTGLAMLPVGMQHSIFSAIPLLGSVGPLIWLGIFCVARALPQSSVTE